jgi:hypothetical protein
MRFFQIDGKLKLAVLTRDHDVVEQLTAAVELASRERSRLGNERLAHSQAAHGAADAAGA